MYPALTLYKSLEYLIDVALLAAILVVVRSTEDLYLELLERKRRKRLPSAAC